MVYNEQILLISKVYYFRALQNTVALNNKMMPSSKPSCQKQPPVKLGETFVLNINVCVWIRKLAWFYPIQYINVRGNTQLRQSLSFYVIQFSCFLLDTLSGYVWEPSYTVLYRMPESEYFPQWYLRGPFLLLFIVTSFSCYLNFKLCKFLNTYQLGVHILIYSMKLLLKALSIWNFSMLNL